MLMRLDPLYHNRQKNCTISKIQDGSSGHFEKLQNRNIAAM